MLGTFIDTIIICTMTALVIITTGSYLSGQSGSDLSIYAFNSGLEKAINRAWNEFKHSCDIDTSDLRN